MIKTLFIFAALFAYAATIFGQLPELIDREILFGNPEISDVQISPDGKQISFLKPFRSVQNIWVKGVSESFDTAIPITSEKLRPVDSYFWSKDSKYVLFVKDNNGDENYNVFAVDPKEKPEGEDAIPTARNLTKGQNVQAKIQLVPENEPNSIYVGINERDPAWHDTYRISIATGERTLVLENHDRLQGVIFDSKNRIRLSIRSAANGNTEILSVESGSPKVIYSCNVFEICTPIRLSQDDKTVYLKTNKGTRDLTELVLLDIGSGKETFVERDPNNRVDFGKAIFSKTTGDFIASTYNDERIRTLWKNKELSDLGLWLENRLPNSEIKFSSSTNDETKWIIIASSDTEPGEIYLFDREKRTLTFQHKSRQNIPRASLTEMKPIRYKSSDGLEIPAYLTLPKGVEAKKLPLVVFPHGGPWQRDSWGYDPYAQFLANRGYAVLQMNFRGSTGYGKKFVDAANHKWSGLTQDDVTWGVRHLVEKGIADPKRVGILGASFGGYMTLAGVTFSPKTYSAAVAIVPISNFISLHDSFPPYWQEIRSIFYKRVGDPENPEDKKRMIRQSPLTHAGTIETPLMVVHGANDPRVNRRESDQIVIALRDRDYPVEYIVAPDEGHGFRRPVNNMAMLAAIEKFLSVHLGGRYESSMGIEVAKRLSEITVDPNDVRLPNELDMTREPTVDLSGNWKMVGLAGGQEVPMNVALNQDKAGFSGTITTPFGNGTISDGRVSANNFTGIVKLDFQGQPKELKLTGKFADGKMTGEMNGPGLPPITFSAVNFN